MPGKEYPASGQAIQAARHGYGVPGCRDPAFGDVGPSGYLTTVNGAGGFEILSCGFAGGDDGCTGGGTGAC